jgi:thioredoxin-dependent peroxiredoxin
MEARMNWIWGIGLAASVAALAGAVRAEDAQPLKVGDKAPNFKLMGTDGKEYTLEQFRGKSAVVIAWYPKALTGG